MAYFVRYSKFFFFFLQTKVKDALELNSTLSDWFVATGPELFAAAFFNVLKVLTLVYNARSP